MTHSGAYSTGLTADGTDLTRTDRRILARVTAGLFDGLEVRGTDTTVPGLAGQIPRNRLGHQRIIVAEGMVMGAGADEAAQRADFLALRQTIFALMRGDQDPYVIVHTNEDGSTYTIEARPLRVEWGEDGIPSYRTMLLYWLAVEVDWTFEAVGS
jgi:hypothetical protein